jgi:4'-phosphopantetheinyl transferase
MDDIDVWLTFYDEIVDESLLAQLRQLLTDAEREQEQRFYFADDRKRHLITRALVRTVLSRYESVAPADWMFADNRYGRPQIANFGESGCDLCFNVSHTRGLIALGVTRGAALGIDVENIQARPAIEVANRFFSPTETDQLGRLAPERQANRFWEYWTFKESYIKARGMGLFLALNKFSFEFPDERGVRLTIDPELDDEAGRWRLWQFRPRPEYLLALCAERSAPEAPRITIRTIVPSVMEEVLDLGASRAAESGGADRN